MLKGVDPTIATVRLLDDDDSMSDLLVAASQIDEPVVEPPIAR